MIDTPLSARAKLLRDSPYFISEADNPLYDKQAIFLVCCEKKPLTQAVSGSWIKNSKGKQRKAEDPIQLGKFLACLGLVYSLDESDYFGSIALVTHDQELIKAFGRTDDKGAGELFGYPSIAISAYLNNECMEFKKQHQLMESEGLPLSMPQFRLSKTNFAQEIKVLKDWFTTLNKYHLI
jgi:hypothetical protein